MTSCFILRSFHRIDNPGFYKSTYCGAKADNPSLKVILLEPKLTIRLIMTEALAVSFGRVNISEERTPSRKEAHRAKIESGFYMCAECFFAFETERESRVHYKSHKAVAKEVTSNYKSAVIAHEQNPCKATLHNKHVQLLRVTSLQMLYKKKKI